MRFDTTGSNRGIFKTACVFLEKKIERNLVSFACRHHMLELVATRVFNAIFGPSTGAEAKLLNDFLLHM